MTQRRWRQRCKECWTMHKTGRNGLKKCRKGRGDRSYQGMASAFIGHSARWTEQARKQRRKRGAKDSRKGILRGLQSRCGRGGSTCASGRYGEEHVKLGGERKTRDSE